VDDNIHSEQSDILHILRLSLPAFFNPQFENYVTPATALYPHIEATCSLESHGIRINSGIEQFIRGEN
jgi:hypothetical protein